MATGHTDARDHGEWGRRSRAALGVVRGRSADQQRLEALIEEYRRRLESRGKAGDGHGDWIPTAQRLLDLAEAALQDRRREKAWALALAALRLEVSGYDGAELEAARVPLRREAEEKLGSWRRDAVLDLLARDEKLRALLDRALGDSPAAREIAASLRQGTADGEARAAALLRARDGDLAEPLAALLADVAAERVGAQRLAEDRVRLGAALQIRDERSANVHRRIALLRQQLSVLSGVLLVTLAGIIALAIWWPLDVAEPPPDGARTWVWVLLFGTLGGSLTALLAAGKQSAEVRIPEQRSQLLIAAARPLVGGAAALFAYMLFAAGVFSVGTGDSAAALLALAFVAGFSERLVSGAAESVAGRGA